MHLFHDWGEWSEQKTREYEITTRAPKVYGGLVINKYREIHYYQERRCLVCNKICERTVKKEKMSWD